MKVLLVWDLLPEEIKFFMIENPTSEQLLYLNEADGNFANGEGENNGTEYLNFAVIDPSYADGDEPDFCDVGVWYDKEVKSPVNGPIDKVFHSGFIL